MASDNMKCHAFTTQQNNTKKQAHIRTNTYPQYRYTTFGNQCSQYTRQYNTEYNYAQHTPFMIHICTQQYVHNTMSTHKIHTQHIDLTTVHSPSENKS